MQQAFVPFSKAMQRITGEKGAFTLHVVNLVRLFTGEKVCGLEMSMQRRDKKKLSKYSKQRTWGFSAFAFRVQ